MNGTPSTRTEPQSPVAFCRTRDGSWAVCGPAALLRSALDDGGAVTVTKKSGEAAHVTIYKVTKGFLTSDGELAYGIIGTSKRCDECGRHIGALYAATDSSGIPGLVCSSCSHEPSECLSFA